MSKLSFCTLIFAIFSPAVYAQTEANAFFDDTQIQVINITMDPADWAALALVPIGAILLAMLVTRWTAYGLARRLP